MRRPDRCQNSPRCLYECCAGASVRLRFILSRLNSVLLVTAALLLSACDRRAEVEVPPSISKTPEAVFAGTQACATCHVAQFEAWSGSQHARAMQVASKDNILGDFDASSIYSERDGKYWARIDNADGELQDLEGKYTFGVWPLQQYLVETSGGRLQTLPIAWDARPENEGGQRWFHVYGDEAITHSDLLHWTGREQNWNYMCAECHSTGLEKNFDASTDSFNTDWAEINVACEACHGPGSRHVADPKSGFDVDLNDAGDASWIMNAATGIALRSETRNGPSVQPEACGRCHARRGVIATEYEFGRPLTDTHRPSLLDEHLYYPDGQILDEVYVYGSFLQSKMYGAGVTCSDCHDPHTAELKTTGKLSGVCASCHLPSKFDSTEHHHHPQSAVECVDCHMPSTTYMVVDPRRDHSFRVPRPELTISTGSPNACTQCHDDQDDNWAVNAVERWYAESSDGPAHFSEAIHAGRLARVGANDALIEVINDQDISGIVRATALTLLAAPFADDVAAVIKRELSASDPLIRIGALIALEGVAPEFRGQWAASLLRDPIRAVRMQAVSTLSPARSTLRQSGQESFRVAELEYVDSQMAISERPEAHLNLGNLYLNGGNAAKAEQSFRLALQIEPRAVAARANLADLYRQTQRDADAEQLLRDGLELDGGSPALHHALGLVLVRGGQPDDALGELALAAELDSNNSRFAYVYAVALNSLGHGAQAIKVLENAQASFPANYDIAWALATMYRDIGQTDDARAAAEGILSQYPNDQNSRRLLESL